MADCSDEISSHSLLQQLIQTMKDMAMVDICSYSTTKSEVEEKENREGMNKKLKKVVEGEGTNELFKDGLCDVTEQIVANSVCLQPTLELHQMNVMPTNSDFAASGASTVKQRPKFKYAMLCGKNHVAATTSHLAQDTSSIITLGSPSTSCVPLSSVCGATIAHGPSEGSCSQKCPLGKGLFTVGHSAVTQPVFSNGPQVSTSSACMTPNDMSETRIRKLCVGVGQYTSQCPSDGVHSDVSWSVC